MERGEEQASLFQMDGSQTSSKPLEARERRTTMATIVSLVGRQSGRRLGKRVTSELPRTTSIPEAAVGYAGLGLPVVVLHGIRYPSGDAKELAICSCKEGGRCGSPGKHPRLRRWRESASTDRDKVAKVFADYPGANVGIAMGGARRLVALDIDGPTGRDSLSQWQAKHGQLPATLSSRSGRIDGGQHLFFSVPKTLDLNAIRNKTRVAPGIDIRCEGGQVVAPPSTHSSGKTYEWVDTSPIADLPEWVFRKLTGASRDHAADWTELANEAQGFADEDRLTAAMEYVSKLPAAVSGQGGHDHTFEAALAVTRGFGIPPRRTFELLRDEFNPSSSSSGSPGRLARVGSEVPHVYPSRLVGARARTAGPTNPRARFLPDL